jgi:hypothetical protein
MTITNEDVRKLLAADTDSVLVLIEGRTEVIGGSETGTDDYQGALEVITRADLLERTGTAELSDNEVAEQAASLDATVSELGG